MTESTPTGPAVLVTVGTDHHPFDRIVRWVDSWAIAHPERACLVQRGSSVMPKACASEEFLAYPDLVHAMSTSTAIVSHGGPATIMDARAAGIMPVVVPRRSDLGEHVDDHQIRFSRWMAGRQQVLLAETETEFHQRLDAVFDDPTSVRISPDDPGVEASIQRFAALVDGLLEDRAAR